MFKADDKMDQIVLDKKECTYSYFADPMYAFMDAEYNQFEVEAENMGDAINYLEDDMPVEVVFYDGKAISVELPTTVVREIVTEPAVKGDTSGKVMKPAKLVGTGFEIAVPLFVENGDKIEIDTRTHEYRSASDAPRRWAPTRGAGGRAPSGALLACAAGMIAASTHRPMAFDFDAAVSAPFRMQPGLRRLAAGQRAAHAVGSRLAPPAREARGAVGVLAAGAGGDAGLRRRARAGDAVPPRGAQSSPQPGAGMAHAPRRGGWARR